MLANGTIIDGKYEILSKIGQGGMSVVYLAMNKKANKQWAIKEVRKDGVKDFEIVRQGLMGEIEMLKRLSHPNLPSIVDVIDTDGTFLIVMDYIEGKPLSEAINEFGAQPQQDVIEYAKQLCDVLEYLHTRTPPIIYRDMKPSNVMLKPDGNITLIDFGTAREFKERNLADTTCLGTQGYAAPEQFGGQGQTDARTDIYTLGATLYHLVTGHNPSEPPYELYPIRQWNPALSSGLERIIQKCTQRNPLDRYQSCAELMYALEHYDEIDDVYRAKQKKKLAGFIASSAVTLAFAGTSLFGYYASAQAKEDDYQFKMEEAKVFKESDRRTELYLEAIDIDPTKIDAYLALVETIKEDSILTEDEKSKLTVLSVDGKIEEMKKKSIQNYYEFAYQVGMGYWLYFEKEEQRKSLAKDWFEDAMNDDGRPDQKNRATIYYMISKFHGEVRKAQDEGNDKGLYLNYWNNLKQLMDYNDITPINDKVTFQLYKEVIDQISFYSKYFKKDQVKREEMVAMTERIFSAASTMDEVIEMKKDKDGEKEVNLKSELMAQQATVLNDIDAAYRQN